MIRENLGPARQAANKLSGDVRILEKFLSEVDKVIDKYALDNAQKQSAIARLTALEGAIEASKTVYDNISAATTPQPWPYGDPPAE